MTTKVKELLKDFSCNKDNSGIVTVKVSYSITDAPTLADAKAEFLTTLALGYTVPLDGVMPVYSWSLDDRKTQTRWEASATFKGVSISGSPDPYVPPSPTVSFSTIGGTQHITHSLETVTIVGDDQELHGAINYDGEEIGGMDIPLSFLTMTEVHVIPTSGVGTIVNTAYMKKLKDFSGAVNNAAFRGFAEGEVFFYGANTSVVNDDYYEVSFEFHLSKNQTNITQGALTVPSRKGWNPLWQMVEKEKDDAAEKLIKKVAGLRVERVFEYEDFNELGIGTIEFI